MNIQISLSDLSDELTQVRTKKKEFLSQIERIITWSEYLTDKLCYYRAVISRIRGNGASLYLQQNLYNLSDEATVTEATDSRICGLLRV